MAPHGSNIRTSHTAIPLSSGSRYVRPHQFAIVGGTSSQSVHAAPNKMERSADGNDYGNEVPCRRVIVAEMEVPACTAVIGQAG